jgi:hypothetical protein
MLFVGILVPVLAGWWLISRVHADLALSLLGLASLPVLVWGSSLGAEIGPCNVSSGCMTSTQHDHLVISIVALVILIGAFVLLSLARKLWGGLALTLALLVGAYSMLTTDLVAAIMLLLFAVLSAAYVSYRTAAERETPRVPDYPPAV